MRLTCTPRRQQRGSVITIAAIALSLIVIALIGAELGYLFFMKREFQKTADLAALAGAQKLQSTTATNRCELAAGAATSNAGQNLSGIAIDTPDCGNWTAGQSSGASAGCFAGTDDHFVVLGSPLNAVRVRINQPAPTLLPFFPWNRTICVQAVAALDEPWASFSVGSGAARLNEGALNQMLSLLLGTNVKLSLVDYTGLANTKVNLLGMIDALDLNVGTYDQLVNTNVTLAKLLNAAIKVLPQSNDSETASLAANLLDDFLKLSGGIDLETVSINLLNIAQQQAGLLSLDASTTDPRSALNGNISALSLLSVALQVANSKSAAGAATTVDLGLLAKVALQAKVIEPPAIAVGPPGYYSNNAAKTQAHTGQIRAKLNVQVLTAAGGDNNLLNIPLLLRVSLPAKQLINLPIYLEVASGDANLEQVHCNTPGGKYDIQINAAPGLAHIFLGNIPAAFDNTSGPWGSLVKERSKLLSIKVDLLGSILTDPIMIDLLVKMDLSIPGNGIVGRKTLSYIFDPNMPASQQNLIQTVGSEQNLGKIIASAINSDAFDVQLNTSGLGLAGSILNELLKGLHTIVSGVLNVLSLILTPVLTLLDDELLRPLFKTLGLQLGYADVQLLSASCQGTAKLVY